MRTTLSSESPLAIDLVSKSILGHWDVSSAVSQCEYQFGQRLIYVQHPKDDSYVPYVEQAQETINAVWNDIEHAVRFAEEFSRRLLPEFWREHDKSGKPGMRFDVYSIHYDLNASHPIYVIGKSNDFGFEHMAYDEDDLCQASPKLTELPEPPENFWLSVSWIGGRKFECITWPGVQP